ncbi:MAG: cupin domain-containing protein [Pseudomonadales bacterium]|nr:cupin domain-containing protein [Pseudomonadales bacterium]
MKVFLGIVVSLIVSIATAAEAPLNATLELPALLEDQEMRIIEIVMEPGQSSTPHRHNAHVYVYVLEGEIEMQVRGGPLTQLKAGETFYESPEDIHQVGRNLSTTERARFLVHMLKQAGAPPTVPVND